MSERLPGGVGAEPSPAARDGEQLASDHARGLAARLAVRLIAFYKRHLSPLLPPMCRFQPTCSEYMATAVTRYGLCRGGLLGTRRLLRCNPFFPGGYDPVPSAPPVEDHRE